MFIFIICIYLVFEPTIFYQCYLFRTLDLYIVISKTSVHFGSEYVNISCCNLYSVCMYLLIFTAGLGINLTNPSENEHNKDGDIPIYFIIMGSFSAFFVCWHTTALIAGAYIKHNNVPRRDTASSCCMRVCHFGAFFWAGALGFISFTIWRDDLYKDLSTIGYVFFGFVAFQYIMMLYCLLETFIDCCLCFNRDNDVLE